MDSQEQKSGRDKFTFDFEAVFEPDDYFYFYKNVLTEERTRNEIEFLAKELEIDKPMRILDLACGHGRHANRLAELGHTVTGVDITSGFLKIARKDAKEKGVTVKYVHEDMRDISFEEEFDRVLLLFTSFGYFEDEGNFKVLENVARALMPRGLFCFDTLNRDVFLKDFRPYSVVEKGNDLLVERQNFDTITGRVYNRRMVIRDGKTKHKRFFVRLYNPTEVMGLLRKAGFVIYKTYGDWDAKSLSSDSRRMIIIAKKKTNQDE